MKTKELYNSITLDLMDVMDESDARSSARLLLEEITGLTQSQLVTRDALGLTDRQKEKLDEFIHRILDHEPIQYVIKKAHFYGRDYFVSPEVLIPRRETEELVYHIINDRPKANAHILDIGTGSGCIPITLKLELVKVSVEALDISQMALNVAKTNAKDLGASITFHEIDILNSQPLLGSYDIIVSNPPYVTYSEIPEMKDNVLDHEPHLALFVKNTKPLEFYDAIINKAKHSLNKGGKLYFEINEKFGKEVSDLLFDANFHGVQVIKDMQGKDRIVKASVK